jgi:hypothetical protein
MMNTEVAGSSRAGRASVRVAPEEVVLKRIEHLTYEGIVDYDGPAPATVRRWLVKHSLADLLAGVDESFAIHFRMDGDEADLASAKKAFHKVPSTTERIIEERTRPWVGKLLYIQGVIRNKLGARGHKCFHYLEDMHVNHGHSLERLEVTAKAMPQWNFRQQTVEEWYSDFEEAL